MNSTLVSTNHNLVRKFYHGTTSVNARHIRNQIDLNAGRTNLDFNPANQGGFYVTDNFDQAQAWASRASQRSRRRGEQVNPAVLRFDVPQSKLDLLDGRVFEEPDSQWAQFVVEGRRGTLQHTHDYVEGPMLLNPRGILRGTPPRAIGHQLAIFTHRAVNLFQRCLQ